MEVLCRFPKQIPHDRIRVGELAYGFSEAVELAAGRCCVGSQNRSLTIEPCRGGGIWILGGGRACSGLCCVGSQKRSLTIESVLGTGSTKAAYRFSEAVEPAVWRCCVGSQKKLLADTVGALGIVYCWLFCIGCLSGKNTLVVTLSKAFLSTGMRLRCCEA